MRYLVFGVGAIGTYIGGSLALAENQVVFIERPGMAEAIQNQGLRLKREDGEYSIDRPVVVENIKDAFTHGSFDAAILAVKSYDTEKVMAQIAEHKKDFPPVLCLQNGVDNETLIGNVLGSGGVIRGTVTTAIGRRGVGDIVVERLRGIGIADEHPKAKDLARSFTLAGLKAVLYSNGKDMKWSKMFTNLPANATSAILNWTASQIYAHDGVYSIEIAQLREALAVMKASGIKVVDLPGTPVRMLSLLVKMPLAISQPLLIRALGKGRGGKMPSFHIDLYGGSGKSEVSYLNGAVSRMGSKLRIAAPINHRLTELLLAITRGEISKEAYANQPDKLMAFLTGEN